MVDGSDESCISTLSHMYVLTHVLRILMEFSNFLNKYTINYLYSKTNQMLFRWSTVACSRQYLFDICLLQYVQYLTPDYGRKDRPKHVECYSIKKKHKIGFTIEI